MQVAAGHGHFGCYTPHPKSPLMPATMKNLKAMFCRVCKFRVGFLMCYRTNRSSGRGIEVAQNSQKLRVGSVTLYPVPVPAPGYFHRPHEVPSRVLNVLQN